MMRAVVPKDGSAQIVNDITKPIPKPGEVLVRIKAATINPLDFKVAQGSVPIRASILGFDFAGEVEEASGPWKVGDRVCGCTMKGGAFADYISVPATALARAPMGSMEQAAALGVAGLTAYQLVCHGNLPSGSRMLIMGASGGVGHLAVQIAKARGYHVTATCSTRNAEFVKKLGADDIVDYTTQDVVSLYKEQPFDGVVDLVGGMSELQGLAVVKQRGYFAELFNNGWNKVYPGTIRPLVAWGLQTLKMKTLALLRWGPDYRVGFERYNVPEMNDVVDLVNKGLVKVHLSETLPLGSCAEAMQRVGQGHTRGKVALTL